MYTLLYDQSFQMPNISQAGNYIKILKTVSLKSAADLEPIQ